MTETTTPSRLERRKARTRSALVAAAGRLLSEGRSSVSIQEITTEADVGFGSFYNHFSSKQELFATAVTQTLEAHDTALEAVTAGVEDPARLLALGVRTTGRLQRQAPEMVRVMLNQGTAVLVHDAGIAPRARADVRAGIDQGRFVVADPELAFMAVGGALLGLMQLLDLHPEVDAGEASDLLAESLLRMLGVPAQEAATIAAEPLPED